MKKATIWIILSVIWVGMIFLQSALPASASGAESSSLLTFVQIFWPSMTEALLRKLAHLLEFAILGYFLTGYSYHSGKFLMTRPAFFSLLVGLCDETIQIYSAGRSSMLSDVWLDFGGAILGILIVWPFFRLRKK